MVHNTVFLLYHVLLCTNMLEEIPKWHQIEQSFFTLILPTKFIASENSTGFFWGGCSSSNGSVISYPLGKKVLNPKIRSLCPLKRSFTLAMTPVVSILQMHKRDKNQFQLTKSRSPPPTKYNQKKQNEKKCLEVGRCSTTRSNL